MNAREKKFIPKITNTTNTINTTKQHTITSIFIHLFTNPIFTAILAVLGTEALTFAEIIDADKTSFIHLISNITKEAQELYCILWTIINSTNYQFIELDYILKNPFTTSKHTKEIITLQKCLFDFMKKTKKLTTKMINHKLVMSLFKDLDSHVTNLLEYYCKKGHYSFIPTQQKKGQDIIYRFSKQVAISAKNIDYKDDVKEDEPEHEIIVKETFNYSVFSSSYEHDYYFEVWKPAQEALSGDYSEDDYSESDEDEHSRMYDDFEEQLHNMGHI